METHAAFLKNAFRGVFALGDVHEVRGGELTGYNATLGELAIQLELPLVTRVRRSSGGDGIAAGRGEERANRLAPVACIYQKLPHTTRLGSTDPSWSI